MTKGVSLSDDAVKRLDIIKERYKPRKISYSMIIQMFLHDNEDADLVRYDIVQAFNSLRRITSTLTDFDIGLIQALTIKWSRMDLDKMETARKGLSKFLSDLDKLDKQKTDDIKE